MNFAGSSHRALAPLVCALFALTACMHAATQAASPTPQPGVGSGSLSPSPSSTASVKQVAPNLRGGLTVRQLAGQRVIYSFAGSMPPASLLALIRAGEVGGVIFFKKNYVSAKQFRAAVAALNKAQSEGPVRRPLLLLTDQEGGLVRRLPGAPTLSEKQVGLQANPTAAATAAGKSAAANLTSYGLNVNLAPVVDVFAKAGNFIDAFQRSYSSSAARAAGLGKAFIEAQQAGGVAATAKHFPGLGTAPAGANTDLKPVTLSRGLGSLREVDEAPFQAAVGAGVRLVMMSWATYPALDAHRPAGLSVAAVRELRERLGFEGVIVSDALEAGALAAYGGAGNRALLAAAAGVDLILCSSMQVSQGEAATAALAAAWTSGKLDHVAFEAAVKRVEALRG